MNTLYRVTPIFVDPQTSCVYVNGMTDMSSVEATIKVRAWHPIIQLLTTLQIGFRYKLHCNENATKIN